MDPIAELLSQLSGVRRGLTGVSGASGLGSVLGLGALGSLGGALGSLGGEIDLHRTVTVDLCSAFHYSELERPNAWIWFWSPRTIRKRSTSWFSGKRERRLVPQKDSIKIHFSNNLN